MRVIEGGRTAGHRGHNGESRIAGIRIAARRMRERQAAADETKTAEEAKTAEEIKTVKQAKTADEAKEAGEAGEADVKEETRKESTATPPSSLSSMSTGIGPAVLNGYVGDFYRAMEGVRDVLKDVELSLPQIVVVGQEGSGKSSVLESLAMLPLFPRQEKLCTRLPIHLKMRHVAECDVVDGDPELMPHRSGPLLARLAKHQIKMKLIYSDGRAPIIAENQFTPAEAAELMNEWMDGIVKEENAEKKTKGVTDHVLEIQVHSPLVPNLNLVDLPGIVAGRLLDEPEDMMQRTRALVETYLRIPHTLVLAVVPAFERVRNSQAFQLVQQFGLMDRTIGVLTMVDRAMDVSNPDGPLAEVMARLDGTSKDIVDLKHGYVAVKNRDTRVSPEKSLDASKHDENAWLEKHLPGFIDRGLASSSVLVLKLEKILAEHVQASWVPQMLTYIINQRAKAEERVAALGPKSQEIVDSILKRGSLSAGHQRVFQLVKPVLSRLLEELDVEMLWLAMFIDYDFLHSSEELELMLAPFKRGVAATCPGRLLAASRLIMNSHHAYLASHLSQIVKNIALSVVMVIQQVIASSSKWECSEKDPQHMERFKNLHCFYASVLWKPLNELLLDEEGLLQRIETSFLEFDPEERVQFARYSSTVHTLSKRMTTLKSLVGQVELHLDSLGFQNTSLGELYLPPPEALRVPLNSFPFVSLEGSFSSEVARMILNSKVPTSQPKPFSMASFACFSSPSPSPPQFQFKAHEGFGNPPPFGYGSAAQAQPVGDNGEGRSTCTFGGQTNPFRDSAKAFGGAAKCPPFAPPVSGAFASAVLNDPPDAVVSYTVGEFEWRLFYAINVHVVTPLLQSIYDVSGLERELKMYLSDHAKVAASPTHIFHESTPTSQERKMLATLMKSLDAARAKLQAMQNSP